MVELLTNLRVPRRILCAEVRPAGFAQKTKLTLGSEWFLLRECNAFPRNHVVHSESALVHDSEVIGAVDVKAKEGVDELHEELDVHSRVDNEVFEKEPALMKVEAFDWEKKGIPGPFRRGIEDICNFVGRGLAFDEVAVDLFEVAIDSLIMHHVNDIPIHPHENVLCTGVLGDGQWRMSLYNHQWSAAFVENSTTKL